MNDPLIIVIRSITNEKKSQFLECDWNDIFDRAAKHNLHLYIYQAITKSVQFPLEMNQKLRKEFLRAIQETEIRRRQAAVVLEEFGKRAIPIIPLKGLWLAEKVYEDPVTRPMHDLDMLVKTEDWETASACLESLGYHAPKPFDGKHRVFAHPDWLAPIELHAHLDHGPTAADDSKALWERAVPATLLGQPCMALEQDDLIMALSSHILSHRLGFFPLRSILDLALVLRKAGSSLDLYALLSKAKERRIMKGTALLIELAETLVCFEQEVSLPAGFRPPPDLVEKAWVLILEHGATRAYTPNPLAEMAKTNSWFARLKILKDRIFLPRNELLARYPWSARPGLGPLAVCARIKDLLNLYAGMMYRWIRKDPLSLNALDLDRQRRDFVTQLFPDKN